MATQTEKLRQVLNSKLWILSRVKKVEQGHIDGFNKEILKACKEAGLVFKPTCEGCPDKKEDGYGLVCIITCSKAFKEIEI